MRRKGLEPLIAVVLLVVFTLTIATIIINNVSPFTKMHVEVSGNQAEEIASCVGSSIEIVEAYANSSGKVSKVDIQNTGTIKLVLNELRIIGTDNTCTLWFDASNNSIEASNSMSIAVPNCQVSCSSYQSSTLETSCTNTDGIHLRTQKVQGC